MKTIFLSHSRHDRNVVNALHNLLKQFIANNNLSSRYDIFYSQESLSDDKNSQDWKKAIVDNLRSCDLVVVLWSPHSLNSSWVNYEIGMAHAGNKKIIATGINGIDYGKYIYNQQVISIENVDNILRVLNNIFVDEKIDVNKWMKKISEKEGDNSPVQKLLREFNNRCIYFVGSKQRNWGRRDKRHSEKFVRELSEGLLKAKYKLASYPTVPYIGEVVANTCSDYKNSYEISGFYKFDNKVCKLATKWTGKKEDWEEIMDRFRDVYLENKHCMIIIGGGENTEKEYNVARKRRNLQIFPIPCFGGFAEKLFNELLVTTNLKDFGHPCINCSRKRERDWKCKKIQEFVQRFKEYRILSSKN